MNGPKRCRARAFAVLIVCLGAVVPIGGQAEVPAGASRITNADVLQMHAAGLPDSIILTAIRQAQQRRFDTSAQGLVALTKAGVSDGVIAAMQDPSARSSGVPSDNVAVAIIGAIATVATAAIGAWATVREKRKRKAAESAIGTTDRYTQLNATHSVDVYEFDMTIHDDGSMDCTRTWSGITTKQTLVNLRIPFVSAVTSPHGRVHQPHVKEIENSALSASFDLSSKSDGRIEGDIVINGNLDAHTGYVGLRAKHRIDKAFLMTRREVLEQYKNDSWKTEYNTVQLPIAVKMLKLEIHFPSSFKNVAPPPSPVVFIGETETVNQMETERVRKTFTFLDETVSWPIPEPRMGLRYGVSWLPPDGVPTEGTAEGRPASQPVD